MLDRARRDFRQAARGLSRRPGLAAGGILTLAVAIGVNAALVAAGAAACLVPALRAARLDPAAILREP